MVLKELRGNAELKEKSKKRVSIRNEEIMKSLSELQEEDEKATVGQKSAAPHCETMLRMRAETAGEMYLGVEDASKFLRFLDFYVDLMKKCDDQESNNAFSDEKIVKAFNLFDGNVKKSIEFLVVADELEELGFEDEKVVSALMLFSNDREAALQFLMKD